MENSKQVITASDDARKKLMLMDSIMAGDPARKKLMLMDGIIASDPARRKLMLMDSIMARDTARKFMDGMPEGVGIKFMDSAANNPARNLMDKMPWPHGRSEELRRFAEPRGLRALPRWPWDGGQTRETIEAAQLVGGYVSEELRRSCEHTALLSRSVDQSLSNLHLSPPANWPHGDCALPPIAVPEANRIWQTNSQLSELTDYAVQSGEEAKSADRRNVRLTFIVIAVAIISTIATIAVADARLKEEIRVLDDISGKLQKLNERPVINPAITPQPQTQPKKGGQPASAR
jgi:hypothetical protein